VTQIKKAKRFLLMIGASLISLIVLYTIIYHYLGNRDFIVTNSYKQFLLQHTEGRRFIIDSGSNSFHGINTEMLEKELGILTINLADNAGFPLNNKLLRIEEYSHSGDIVMLPLEWFYYTYSDVPGNFSENILGDLRHYYFYDSLFDEVLQIWSSPFSSFRRGIKRHRKLIRKKNEYLKEHIEKFNNGERGTFNSIEPVTLEAEIKVSACDPFIFGKTLTEDFVLSEIFKKNVKTIKRLQKKRIKVFFTWPIVVGKDCYSKTNRKKIDHIIHIIKNYIQENGLTIIGSPYENNFLEKDMLDTNYHIIPEAREQRTKRLIMDIRQSTVYKWFEQNQAMSYSLDISL